RVSTARQSIYEAASYGAVSAGAGLEFGGRQPVPLLLRLLLPRHLNDVPARVSATRAGAPARRGDDLPTRAVPASSVAHPVPGPSPLEPAVVVPPQRALFQLSHGRFQMRLSS